MEIKKNGIRSLSRQQKYILVIIRIIIIIIITIIVTKVPMVKKKNTENLDQRFMTLA